MTCQKNKFKAQEQLSQKTQTLTRNHHIPYTSHLSMIKEDLGDFQSTLLCCSGSFSLCLVCFVSVWIKKRDRSFPSSIFDIHFRWQQERLVNQSVLFMSNFPVLWQSKQTDVSSKLMSPSLLVRRTRLRLVSSSVSPFFYHSSDISRLLHQQLQKCQAMGQVNHSAHYYAFFFYGPSLC